jgi:hypothetical protein
MPDVSGRREQSFEVEIASPSRLPQAEFRAKVKAALNEAPNGLNRSTRWGSKFKETPTGDYSVLGGLALGGSHRR